VRSRTPDGREEYVSRPELFPFSQCIFYAVITSMVSLDRVSLKTKVVDAPEILVVIEQIPNLKELLNSLYDCDYGKFFKVCPQNLRPLCGTLGPGAAADFDTDPAGHAHLPPLQALPP